MVDLGYSNSNEYNSFTTVAFQRPNLLNTNHSLPRSHEFDSQPSSIEYFSWIDNFYIKCFDKPIIFTQKKILFSANVIFELLQLWNSFIFSDFVSIFLSSIKKVLNNRAKFHKIRVKFFHRNFHIMCSFRKWRSIRELRKKSRRLQVCRNFGNFIRSSSPSLIIERQKILRFDHQPPHILIQCLEVTLNTVYDLNISKIGNSS